MRVLLGTVVVFCLGVAVSAMPPRPKFDTEGLCQSFKEKCEAKNEQKDCKARAEECLKYAEHGLNVTWSFCMYSNNDDVATCNKRIQVDYEIITDAVRKGSFKYDFAD